MSKTIDPNLPKTNLLQGRNQKLLLVLFTYIIIGFLGYRIGKTNNIAQVNPQQKLNPSSVEEMFPPLDMPLDYFDTKDVSLGALGTINNTSYSVLYNSEGYQSYPTTIISLKPDLYSSIPEPLPPIKSDSEIHGNNPEFDFYGNAKNFDIQKYGDLARRFVGVTGEGWSIDSVNYADVDKDDKKETIISLSKTGANIIGQRDVIIKGDKVIFSTDETTFSTLTPAKNVNGFFLQWDDNFKSRDGYTTTRFIYDGKSFVPVYEQQTRYIRIKS